MTEPSIPQSSALTEASLEDSFTELFSRDPEHLTRVDRDKIVAQLILQRERLAKAEEAGTGLRPKRAANLDAPVIHKTLDDLGL